MDIRIVEMHKGKFTDEELEAVFNKVKDPEHWKNPIEVAIEEKWLAVVQAAITHYHGVIPEVETKEGEDGLNCTVISRGYLADSDWV